jgi:acyl carrier protein
MPDMHFHAQVPARHGGGNAAALTDAALLAALVEIVRDVLEDRGIQLTLDTPVDDLAGWDSMNHVAIMVEAECRFGVLFELTELEEVPTVGHLVRLIRAKRASGLVAE